MQGSDFATCGIISIDANGVILSVDKSCCALFGYNDASEVVGQLIHDAFIPSPYREQHASYLRRYLATGVPRVIGRSRHVEAVHRDGTRFPVKLAVNEVVTQGVGPESPSRIFIGMVHRLQDARGTITVTADGTILSCDGPTQDITGWQPSVLVGQNVSVLVPEPYRSRHRSYMQGFAQTGRSRIVNATRNLPMQHYRGHVFPVSLEVTEVGLSGVRLYRAAFQAINTSLETMFTLDRMGMILSSDYSFVPVMFGYKAEEIKGSHISRLLPGIESGPVQGLPREGEGVGDTRMHHSSGSPVPSVGHTSGSHDSIGSASGRSSGGIGGCPVLSTYRAPKVAIPSGSSSGKADDATPGSRRSGDRVRTRTPPIFSPAEPNQSRSSGSYIIIPGHASMEGESPRYSVGDSWGSGSQRSLHRTASEDSMDQEGDGARGRSGLSPRMEALHMVPDVAGVEESREDPWQGGESTSPSESLNVTPMQGSMDLGATSMVPSPTSIAQAAASVSVMDQNEDSDDGAVSSPGGGGGGSSSMGDDAAVPRGFASPESQSPPQPQPPIAAGSPSQVAQPASPLASERPQLHSSVQLRPGEYVLTGQHKDGSRFLVCVELLVFVLDSGEQQLSLRIHRHLVKESRAAASSSQRRVPDPASSDASSSGSEPLLGADQDTLTRVGHYRLGATVGQGSYGLVRKAIHVRTRQIVAIKTLNSGMMNDAEVDRCLREIRILESMDHPNIINLHKVIRRPEYIHMVMEYVSGGELHSYVCAKGRLSEAEARPLFVQLLRALRYCHSHGIIHRDIKHKNILLDLSQPATPVLKLCDFGLSTWAKEDEWRSTFCGTPAYAAPEMILAKKYTGPPADVWSSGIVLFAMLTGKFPFKNVMDIIEAKFTPPPYISEVCVDVLDNILQIEPENRATVDTLLAMPWCGVGVLTVAASAAALSQQNPNAASVGQKRERNGAPSPPSGMAALMVTSPSSARLDPEPLPDYGPEEYVHAEEDRDEEDMAVREWSLGEDVDRDSMSDSSPRETKRSRARGIHCRDEDTHDG